MEYSANLLTITRATIEDLPQAIPLFDAYRQFYKYASDLEGARRFLRAHLEQQTSVIFLAFRKNDEGRPHAHACGFMQLYPLFSSEEMKRLWLLNDLFVAPEARRLGIGRALLEQARELAVGTGATGLMLQTAIDNFAAQSVYEAAGWQRDEQFYVYNLHLEGDR